MHAVEIVIHVRRKPGMQDNVAGVDAAPFQTEQQFPSECAPGRRHLGRARLFRINSLVVIEVPRRGDVFVADRFPEPINQIHKLGAGD